MTHAFSLAEVDDLLAIGFDMKHYRDHNPDIAELDWHALLTHFLTSGASEGRSFSVDSNAEDILAFVDKLHCQSQQKDLIEDALIENASSRRVTASSPRYRTLAAPRYRAAGVAL